MNADYRIGFGGLWGFKFRIIFLCVCNFNVGNIETYIIINIFLCARIVFLCVLKTLIE